MQPASGLSRSKHCRSRQGCGLPRQNTPIPHRRRPPPPRRRPGSRRPTASATDRCKSPKACIWRSCGNRQRRFHRPKAAARPAAARPARGPGQQPLERTGATVPCDHRRDHRVARLADRIGCNRVRLRRRHRPRTLLRRQRPADPRQSRLMAAPSACAFDFQLRASTAEPAPGPWPIGSAFGGGPRSLEVAAVSGFACGLS